MTIGHNGGPPLKAFTRKAKLERIRDVLEDAALTAIQKCIGIGIIMRADPDGFSEVGTEDLRKYASVKDRETVFKATAKLNNYVAKDRGVGRANRYAVLPKHVVDSIVDAYNAKKENDKLVRSNRTSSKPTSPIEPDTALVRSDRTSPVSTGPIEPARPVETDRFQSVDMQAEKERSPHTPLKENTTPPRTTVENTTQQDASDDAVVADATCSPQHLLECFIAYNDLALRVGIPVARTFTPERRKSMRARLKDHGVDAWPLLLANIERSAFLQGKVPGKTWKPTGLDWFLAPLNFCKVIEGAYGNGAHAEQQKESQAERFGRVLGEIDFDERRP